MTLIFDIVKSGRNAPSVHTIHFDRNGGVIGRASDASWVLTDPQSYISSTHVRIEFKEENFFLIDESTNGTFLKFPYKKLPPGQPIPIKASDTFIIGDHEIQARFSDNEYGDDDIVVSHNQSASSITGIIPGNDFLFESSDSGFASLETNSAPADIMNLVGGTSSINTAPTTAKPKSPEVIDLLQPSTPSVNQIIPDDAFDDDLDLSGSRFDQLNDPIKVPGFTENKTVIPGVTDIPSSNHQTSAPQIPKEEPFDINSLIGDSNQSTPSPVSSFTPEVEEIEEAIIEPMNSHNQVSSTNLLNGEIVDESLMILSKKLGIDLEALSSAQRNTMMEELGDTIVALLSGVHHTLSVTKKMQLSMDVSKEVCANTLSNPFGTHGTPDMLLQTQDRKSMIGNSMSLCDAVKQSFDDINHHTISLHSATSRVLNSVGVKFSPRNLEYEMGIEKRFGSKNSAMWESYKEAFHMFDVNPHAGEEMFEKNFKQEYETVAKSLNLTKKV